MLFQLRLGGKLFVLYSTVVISRGDYLQAIVRGKFDWADELMLNFANIERFAS